MNPTPPQAAGSLNRFLNAIEAAGNKLPHITMLFIWALVITLVISLALSYVSFDYRHPSTGAVIAVTNMLAPANLLDLVVNSVKNFMGFPPLGITLVATLGIGIAEGSGFIHTLLRKLMSYIPRAALTPAVVIVSILCHVASDSVYVILMPLAALMFYCAGRHPLAGVACSFAGLSGGFTASYTPSVIDPVMQSFTQAAAQTLDASYSVNVLCNYFFALGGTFFVIAACWYVTDKIVEPRLWATMPLDKGLENDPDLRITPVSALENSAYRQACTVFLGLAALLFVLCWPEGSMLRAPDGSLTSPKAPVMQAIVPLIFIFFSLPGIVYGYAAGTFKSSSDVIKSMEEVMKMLLGFMVFAFFAAQFLYVFGKSGIGTLLAISGAEFLKDLGMPSAGSLLGIIIFTGMLNLLITSATSKWAILSTIFVPMLMMLGISPELTQAAFRVSDSAVNVCTPMFPFYPLLIMYCQKYCKQAGVGTLSSMMIPYTLALLVALTFVLYNFLRYVAVSSESDPKVGRVPSSEGQRELAKLLARELEALGLVEIELNEHAILTALLPANVEGAPAVGWVAHLDTVPVSLSPDVKAQVIHYEGGDVLLNAQKDIWVRLEEHPELAAYAGQDIVFTDGTSVLGADNKAAVANVMTMLAVVTRENRPHGDIRVAFVPDEEIGLCGSKLLDLKKFKVDFAYTIDCCALGEIVWETFNACSVSIRIKGVTAHPMSAKGVLVNPLLVATDLINRFDRLQTPEQTEGKEGYWWFTDCEANAAECRLTMNIRDFDRSRYDSRKAFVLEAVEAVRAQHPRAVIEAELVDVYSNIADSLGDDRSPVELLYKAADNLGITTNTIAMRGGTDGSALSAKGLVTPNYFTGACNFHSYAEFLPLPSLHKSLEMTLELVRLTAGK